MIRNTGNIMEGYLEKRGRGQVFSFHKPWTPRLFVLDVDKNELSYYTTKNGMKSFRGKVNVLGGHVAECGPKVGKKFAFEFHSPSAKSQNEDDILILAAVDENERQLWMSALSKHSKNEIRQSTMVYYTFADVAGIRDTSIETKETQNSAEHVSTLQAPAPQDPLDVRTEMFIAKMRGEGLSDAAISAFTHSFQDLLSGSTGMISESSISPVLSLPSLDKDIREVVHKDHTLLQKTVMLKLNGGLGTSMGLDKAKSLLTVKDDNTFLDLTAKQVISMREQYGFNVKFMLMNSFNTSEDTMNFLKKYPSIYNDPNIELMQNKVPKVDKETMLPVEWPANKHLEWCPPGHGDLYSALYGSGKLDQLLAQGVKYMFVSNSDNLGATLDIDLLSYFVEQNIPFLMECCERTEADKKGGHLAIRTADNQLILRESAQCAKSDEAAFQSIDIHKYFNTNNLWIRLDLLEELMENSGGYIPLPTIFNSKTVDPQLEYSSKVFQLETAMGAAIECFKGANAVCVPRSRFAPVKKCSDLFLLRSDAYIINSDNVLVLNPACRGNTPIVEADAFKFVQSLEAAVGTHGYPSLVNCRKLKVVGNVWMHSLNVFSGDVRINNSSKDAKRLPPSHYADTTVDLASMPFVGKLKASDPYLQYGGFYAGDFKDTDTFNYVTFTECPKFTPAHKSAMARHTTPQLFERLKNVQSNKGYTFSNAIMTGVVTPHLGVGATAGDEHCWEVFKDLFYPIIQDWHGYDPSKQFHPMDLDPSKLKFSSEQSVLFSRYVESTRIRAARNISGFALPPGTTDADRAGVENVLRQAFDGLSGELSGQYHELGQLSESEISFLLEKGFLFQIPSARNLLTGAGAARSWPDNRGIFYNETQTALCWVNEEDHCRIISMEMGGNIPSVFTRFCALSDALKASAEKNGTKLMWNERLGFLGTCPSNLGTGLRASVMVRLPAFNSLLEEHNHHQDKELLEQVCSAFDLQPRGSSGEHSAAIGAKFDVSNKQRLGFSEVELVQKMIDGVTKLIEFEEMLASGVSPSVIREKMLSMNNQPIDTNEL